MIYLKAELVKYIAPSPFTKAILKMESRMVMEFITGIPLSII